MLPQKKISRWGLVIKLADRLDNISDLEDLEDREFADKYKKETAEIIDYLEKNRDLTPTQIKLINAIRDKLINMKSIQNS